MASVTVYDLNKNKVGNVELNDKVFSGEVRPHLLNIAVRAQIAWKHEYKTANTLTRTEVHGTRKKMFKQKGTGQARHGDAKAPIFVGGGKAHGPKPRRVRHKVNRKVMRAALICALSNNHKEDRIFIVDKLEFAKPSTKEASKLKAAFGIESFLIVNSSDSDQEGFFNQSIKNITKSKFLKPEGVNVFDILKYKNILISKKAIDKLTERLTHA